MEEVSEHHRSLLNVDKVSEYLKEVAPIDYMLEFKNMLYNQCLPIQYKDFNEELDHIRLTVNDEIDIRKRYGLMINGTGDEISSLQFSSSKIASLVFWAGDGMQSLPLQKLFLPQMSTKVFV